MGLVYLVMVNLFPIISLMNHLKNDPTKHFDFWVGNWQAEAETRSDPTKEEWTKGKATNKIEKILEGKVVQENFTMPGLTGKSWSVYDPKGKVWHQTWVDNQSGYIALTGKWENNKMVLYDTPLNPGDIEHRMVFQDITAKSFLWLWEVKKKDGSWAATFKCHYKRV